MNHSKKLLVVALGLLVASALPAQAGEKKVNNYVRSSDSTLVRDSEKNCVRSSDMTTKLLEECGDAEKEVVVKKDPAKVEIAVVEQGTVLEHVVINNLQFEFDSAVLTTEDKAILDNAYTRLAPYKDLLQQKLSHIDVTGYTDTSGPEAYNQTLSEKRANSVADYMAGKGTDRGHMVVKGMGEANPVADNGTRDGRIRNRRVELDVIKD
jgi:outer membrane protein OmpA-like peptidoglycan-associated protein